MTCVLNGSCDSSSRDLPFAAGFFPVLGLRIQCQVRKSITAGFAQTKLDGKRSRTQDRQRKT
jgi:hypothetical protein